MKYIKCNENGEIPVLSNEAIREIEGLVGNDVPYIIAFDPQANLSVLIKNTSKAREVDIEKEGGLKATKLLSLDSIGHARILGSHTHVVKHGGTSITVDLPPPHPPA